MSSDELGGPILDSFQQNCILALRALEPDAVLQWGLLRAQQRGRIKPFDLLVPLLLMQTRTEPPFWAHIELFDHKHPQTFLPRAALDPLSLPPVLVFGIALTQEYDLASGL